MTKSDITFAEYVNFRRVVITREDKNCLFLNRLIGLIDHFKAYRKGQITIFIDILDSTGLDRWVITEDLADRGNKEEGDDKMMNICNNGHDEIVYDSKRGYCPLCEMLVKNKELNELLEPKVDKLYDQIEFLESGLEKIRLWIAEGFKEEIKQNP